MRQRVCVCRIPVAEHCRAPVHPPPPPHTHTGTREWQGSFQQLPPYMGPADVVALDALLLTESGPAAAAAGRSALLKASLLLCQGGCLLLVAPAGSAVLPRDRLQPMVVGLPLEVLDQAPPGASGGAASWAVVGALRVPLHYRLPAPVLLQGPVVTGFGRGSRQLGVPTANIDPSTLSAQLASLPQGVYFGWAQLCAPPGSPPADARPHKMVMNVGRRPTVNAGDEAPTVEAHILHAYAGDFYGRTLRVAALGYLRPEMKFAGMGRLLARIRTDIGLARLQLETCKDMDVTASPELQRYFSAPFSTSAR